MIKQFRKKPVVIEAIQFDGTNKEEIQNFIGDEIGQDVNSKDLFITTLEGIMIASVGDYIIKGVQGEFYPCKPDIFEQTYNEVQENASDLITEVNVTELLKIAKQSEQQYNAVVKQNKELQAELKRLKDENKYLHKDLAVKQVAKMESNEYWDKYVFDEENPFNKENAYKELSDYYFLLKTIPELYMHITGGTLSKTNYYASSVYEAYNDSLERVREEYEECLEKIMEEIAYLDDNCSEELSELKSAYARILKLINRTL